MTVVDPLKGIAGLKGALRYVRAYRDHVFVVKMGGEVVAETAALEQVSGQLALLSSLGIRLVVVHGGGPQATALSRKLGHEPVIVAGRRVTDDTALEVAKMVYAGSLNVDILSRAARPGRAGGRALGSGRRPADRPSPPPGVHRGRRRADQDRRLRPRR